MTSSGPSTSPTTFTYQGESSQAVTETKGASTTAYAFTPYGPLAERQVGVAGSLRYFLKDLHGDVVGLIAQQGAAPSATVSYSPYGEVASSSGTWSGSLGFQGQRTDPSTSLLLTDTRAYAPWMGRFDTADTLFGEPTDPMSMNSYVYAQDSPVLYSDPSGMCACKSGNDPWRHSSGNSSEPDEGAGAGGTASTSGDTGGITPEEMLAWGGMIRWLSLFMASDSNPGCGFLGWRCYDDALGAAADVVVRGTKTVVAYTWYTYRFAVNAPLTTGAAIYASARGGKCGFEAQLTVACYGMNGGYPRGGLAVGNTFITGSSRGSVSAARLSHERKHSDQWAVFGLALPGLYLGNEAIARLIVGENRAACYNVFEIAAGLDDGGYNQC